MLTIEVSVSLCATVFNEGDSIDVWLGSIVGQTRIPDEIVICDAGSTDGTTERLLEFAEGDSRITVVVEPGANVPEGRNHAIAAAAGPIIAVTDAGTILRPDWLERLVAPFEEQEGLGVSAGFYVPAGRNRFERVLASAITPMKSELAADGFPPSSRSVAFRRDLWEEVGGYPDWLRAGEDLVFDHRLKEAGARFHFADDAIVSWYPRPTLRAFFAQYRHYARGDGHGQLRTLTHVTRFGAYSVGLVLLAGARGRRLPKALLVAGFIYHMKRPFRRMMSIRPFSTVSGALYAFALLPCIEVIADVARMLGFAQGLWERWRIGEDGLKEARFESHRKESADEQPADRIK